VLELVRRYPWTLLSLAVVAALLGVTLVMGRVTTVAAVLAPIAIFLVVVATASDRRRNRDDEHS
jgi:uncharacterized membrane protein YtjA (UPF0391 family)